MNRLLNLFICLFMCIFCGLFGYILRGEQIYKGMWEKQISLSVMPDGYPEPSNLKKK